jgi:dihydroneopterin aldolase
MTDRILLHGMRFQGHHGVSDAERGDTQPIDVDVELARDLREPGRTDDLATTVNYARVYDLAKAVVEDRTFRLLEAIAETIAGEVLRAFDVEEVTVRVRKPTVAKRLGGLVEYSGVQITRRAG